MRTRYRTLAEYFDKTKPKRTQQWLADQLDVDRSYVSLIMNGQRQPSLELALRIERITGVPLTSLVTNNSNNTETRASA